MRTIFVLVLLAIGVVIGFRWFPEKWNKINVNIQLIATLVLIFSMGVSLGSRPNFFQEIASMGTRSLVFALLGILGSVLLVYPLSRKFFLSNSDIEAYIEEDIETEGISIIQKKEEDSDDCSGGN